MAQWIWKFGEFEIYHNMLVHNRRIGYGYHETPMWKIYAPSTNIEFSKEVNTAGGVFKITVLGYHTLYIDDAIKYGISEVTLEPGVHRVKIVVSNPESFPALYIDGVISTDETWFAAELGALGQPAASYPAYDTPDKRPDVFPFAYEPMQYVSKEEINGSVLFDFGKETFCKTHFIFPEAGKYFISFGESREEALDRELSYVHVTADAKDGTYDYVPTAFRYIYVDCAQTDVAAEYQYLPLEYRGAFRCDEAVVNKVWDMSASSMLSGLYIDGSNSGPKSHSSVKE